MLSCVKPEPPGGVRVPIPAYVQPHEASAGVTFEEPSYKTVVWAHTSGLQLTAKITPTSARQSIDLKTRSSNLTIHRLLISSRSTAIPAEIIKMDVMPAPGMKNVSPEWLPQWLLFRVPSQAETAHVHECTMNSYSNSCFLSLQLSGQYYMCNGQYAKGEKSFQRALEMNPLDVVR